MLDAEVNMGKVFQDAESDDIAAWMKKAQQTEVRNKHIPLKTKAHRIGYEKTSNEYWGAVANIKRKVWHGGQSLTQLRKRATHLHTVEAGRVLVGYALTRDKVVYGNAETAISHFGLMELSDKSFLGVAEELARYIAWQASLFHGVYEKWTRTEATADSPNSVTIRPAMHDIIARKSVATHQEAVSNAAKHILELADCSSEFFVPDIQTELIKALHVVTANRKNSFHKICTEDKWPILQKITRMTDVRYVQRNAAIVGRILQRLMEALDTSAEVLYESLGSSTINYEYEYERGDNGNIAIHMFHREDGNRELSGSLAFHAAADAQHIWFNYKHLEKDTGVASILARKMIEEIQRGHWYKDRTRSC